MSEMSEEEKRKEAERKALRAEIAQEVLAEIQRLADEKAARVQIPITDQVALNNNVQAIADGTVDVVVPGNEAKELGENEVDATDQVGLGANLTDIASGKKRVAGLSAR